MKQWFPEPVVLAVIVTAILFGPILFLKAQEPYKGSGLVLFPVKPCRLVDTRQDAAGILKPVTPRTIQATRPRKADGTVDGTIGTCAIDPAVKALAATVTVIPTSILGYLTIWPAGEMPIVSTLNATRGGIVNAHPIIALSPQGAFQVFATEETHLIVDISGVFAWDGVTPNALPPAPVPIQRKTSQQ